MRYRARRWPSKTAADWKWLCQVMGHLPAEVAKWLAPLIIGSLVEAAGCVLEDPTAPGAPTTLAVQVH